MSTVEQLPGLKVAAPGAIENFAWQPSFAILLYRDANSCDAQVERSTISVERQIYRSFALWECGGSEELTIAADYVVPLRAGDTLSEEHSFASLKLCSESPKRPFSTEIRTS
jgi:hypothetical protein